MSRVYRCRQEGRRPGQYHRRHVDGCLILTRALALLLALGIPSHSQSLLRIQVLEGEGFVHAAASKSERPLSVQITDETGRPLEGVAVSFRLPEEGPSGVFQGGMKTEIAISTADGRAAVHGMRWNRVEGPFQIRITAAKGESRAGAICSQYISGAPPAQSFRSTGSKKKKWIALAAIAAGGAAAGLAIGMRSKPQGAGGPSGTPPAVQIGLPSISIGRP